MAALTLEVKAEQERATFARQQARIILETSTTELVAVTGSTAGGDARRLRGIPAIGRSVAGAIPGTSPHGVSFREKNAA